MRELYSTQLAAAAGVLTLIITAFFALIQSPQLLDFQKTAAVKLASAVPYPVEGRRLCNNCHGPKGVKPYPARHFGWNNECCLKCHMSDDAAAPKIGGAVVANPSDKKKKMAQPVPHPLQGMEPCDGCHGPNGSLPYPEDHSGWKDDSCIRCHMPLENKGAKPKL